MIVGQRLHLRPILLALLATSALACERTRPEEHDDDHPREPEHHDAEHAAAGEALVRIDPGMLRDLRITTAPAQARSAGEGTVVLGELRVNQDAYAEVGSPAAGRVQAVLVAQGAVVKAGQPLAEVVSAALGNASADLLRAQARHAVAVQARDRKKQLVDEQVVAARELQEAEAVAAAAAADVRAAKAALRALGIVDTDIKEDGEPRLLLRAPIAGTVVTRDVAKGAQVDADKTLFRIADLAKLWLVVHAFERDAVRVKAGSDARITFPSLPGQTFAGQVAYLGAEVDATSRTIPVRIEVNNENGLLRPGMSGSAWLTLGDAGEQVVTVPAMALQRVDEGWAVFLPKSEGVFEPRLVGRGRDLGGEVEIVSGVSAGERVVVDGAFLLKAEIEKAAGGGDDHPH